MNDPHYQDDRVTLHRGDCLDVLRGMPDNSVDAIVCDPPYGLSNTSPDKVTETIVRWAQGDREYVPQGQGFMGASWDAFVPPVAVWDECLRVLKPGGHLVAFAGSRTQDLMGLSIRLAGFDVRENLAWLYGSGFPKSLDVGKAIDKLAGAEREVALVPTKPGNALNPGGIGGEGRGGWRDESAPATPEAAQWDGWGTALKPAFEPIVFARKPLAEKTVARNVLAHGTGAINVDGCRIGTTVETWPATRSYGGDPSEVSFTKTAGGVRRAQSTGSAPSGRWPANVLLDQHAAAWVDEQSGVTKGRTGMAQHSSANRIYGEFKPTEQSLVSGGQADEGGASRFFYTAKAPRSERPNVDGVQHPTVKPLAIMRWLIRLVTPPGGTVLDPFAGSGTTIEAALIEGFNPVGIEMEPDYLPLIQHRIDRQAGTLTTHGRNTDDD